MLQFRRLIFRSYEKTKLNRFDFTFSIVDPISCYLLYVFVCVCVWNERWMDALHFPTAWKCILFLFLCYISCWLPWLWQCKQWNEKATTTRVQINWVSGGGREKNWKTILIVASLLLLVIMPLLFAGNSYPFEREETLSSLNGYLCVNEWAHMVQINIE